ncbi:MAG TPA: vanadium-dependent haloperoxidase, partial [Terriglobales bacterium]|nr:vanadium-dependent haloperoxidase [Terriglobales bacterium]
MKSMHRGISTMRNFAVCVFTVILWLGCAVAKADTVLDWNEIAVNTAIANGQSPFAQARFAAIAQLAVFEAVNSITGDYQPYLGTIQAPRGASVDAAAIQAAYRVLSTYFPKSVTTLDTQRANSLAAIADGQAKQDGIKTGDDAGKAMIKLRTDDGSSPAQFKTPGAPLAGEWEATPSCPTVGGVQVGAFFHWQHVMPFGIASAEAFLLDPPPALKSSEYAKAYNEVKTVGSHNSTERSQDRSNVATFYAASSPTQVFNQAARQIAQAQGRSISENARALALINMAISDAAVAAFGTKYHYATWRPETAVHNADVDDNARTDQDSSWEPLIVAPCFPAYPSNHGSLSGGGAEVLRRVYGEGGHAITITNPAFPTLVYHYTNFNQILADISDARVYG